MPITAQTRDGRPWTPEFLEAIDPAQCIGCGRCFKVCAQAVMKLMAVDEDGEIVAMEDDDDEDEFERMVMVVNDAGACTGCGACARVCSKNCQTHVAAEAV